MGQAEVFEFSNEEVFVRINENVRQRDCFIVQPISSPVNTRLMELLVMIDAFKRSSAGRITAVMPYYGYGRSDKKDQPRVPITARLVANLLETAGADRILTLDLHAGQIQGFFNIPLDELTALFIFTRYFKEKRLNQPVVVATDVGDSKRARNLAERLDTPLAIIEKRRSGNVEKAEALNLIGEVEGHDALVIDDEILTGGTILQAANVLKAHGAQDIYVAATHAILSGDATSALSESPIKELVITDTLPVAAEKITPQMKVVTVAPLLGEAISRIHTGQSVGALFQ